MSLDPPVPDLPRLLRTLVRFVLVEPTHPGNVGAAARALKTMGFERLCLIRPRRFPSADATARAAGADDLLHRAFLSDTLGPAIESAALVLGTTARSRRLGAPVLDPADAAAAVHEAAAAGRETAILFGREHSGLSNEELDRCNALVRIPTDEAFSSLNIASAVQILAYELRRGAVAQAPRDASLKRATAAEVEALYEHFERALIEIGYLDPTTPKFLMRRIRRLFNRAGLEEAEVSILRGVLKAAQRSSVRAAAHDRSE